VGLWGIPALQQTGGEYWRFGMGDQVFKRAIAVKDSHGMKGILGFVALLPLYFLTFFISFFPWSTRVPLTLRRWWPERSRDDLGWYLLVVAALVFGVFSVVVTKLVHYTMPAFPCLALWLARQISTDNNVSIWFSRRLAAMVVIILSATLIGMPLLKSHLLTENVWRALQGQVRPETRVGCFGYDEPSLVWRFRNITTNRVTLGRVDQVKNFLTNPPPWIIVLPTKNLAQFEGLTGPQIQIHGFDMVKFNNWDLTAILRP
jgi:4-amino-4-deoxy-L-arabinose transferase-like glycosyltransferase